jgi:cell wall-associated NlpC family hydrolase
VSHFDRRLVPARPDLAAEHLRGQVEAGRFVAGIARRVIDTAAPLRREPNPEASLDTEALFGEVVTVYDELEGWAWGQLARDSYVGWLPANSLGAVIPPTHRVCAVRTFIYPTPSIKRPPLMVLSMGSEVTVTHADGLFQAIEGGGFVFGRHLAPLGAIESDPVSVAERFLGTPYLWGGRTSLGLDCSALVQTAMHACGIACPRDSDMQESALGNLVDPGPDLAGLERGDLLFWRGHVALVRDAATLVHASGHTMTVAIEPLRQGIARIAAAGDPLSSVRRIG